METLITVIGNSIVIIVCLIAIYKIRKYQKNINSKK